MKAHCILTADQMGKLRQTEVPVTPRASAGWRRASRPPAWLPLAASNKKKEYIRYKSNKVCTGSIEGKSQNSNEKIKEYLNQWRESPCSWIGRLNTVKISILFNFIYRFNSTPIKISTSYFVDIDELILKFTWRGGKRPRTANTTLKEKNKVRGLTTQLQDLL